MMSNSNDPLIQRGGTYHGLFLQPVLYAHHHILVQHLPEPHHAWALQAFFTAGASWQLFLGDVLDSVIWIQKR